MTPVIQQTVRFRTTPRALFEMFLDSKKRPQGSAEGVAEILLEAVEEVFGKVIE